MFIPPEGYRPARIGDLRRIADVINAGEVVMPTSPRKPSVLVCHVGEPDKNKQISGWMTGPAQVQVVDSVLHVVGFRNGQMMKFRIRTVGAEQLFDYWSFSNDAWWGKDDNPYRLVVLIDSFDR